VGLYRFEAGHGSMVIDERVRQMRAELDFVLPRIGLARIGLAQIGLAQIGQRATS